MFAAMNWKSYTIVSGAGLLATWFAASQPRMPGSVTPEQPREAAAAAAAVSDIEREAERLQARPQNHVLYREPARNLFRFSARDARPAAPPQPDAPVLVLPEAAPAPLPPPLKLTAIAVDGEARTAVFSTPAGIVLAREGDELPGGFRLARVDDDAVEIVAAADGAATRLTLTP